MFRIYMLSYERQCKTFCCIFIDAVSVSDYVVLKSRITGKYELERIWKEAATALFRNCSSVCWKE
jgi:hypothetical protein